MASGLCTYFYHRSLMRELAMHPAPYSNRSWRLKQTWVYASLGRMLPRGRRYYFALCKIHSCIWKLSVCGFMWFSTCH